MKHAKVKKTPAEELAMIRMKLGHVTFEGQTKSWLDTGSKRLNSALGSRELGLPYGKMYELHGMESHGKTLLLLFLAAKAQADGAIVGWLDAENSFDKEWAQRQGLDPERVYLFQPSVIREGGSPKGKLRLQYAEELCAEVEEWASLMVRKDPNAKMFLAVDSVTAFLTRDEASGGVDEQNMRTRAGLPMFLSQLLRRWTPMALSYNMMVIFINQIRVAPGVRFGNPERTPGGNALRFYCAVRARVTRAKGGRLFRSGEMIGLQAIVSNVKNKAGGESRENLKCGFKCFFDGSPWKFLPAKKLKKEVG